MLSGVSPSRTTGPGPETMEADSKRTLPKAWRWVRLDKVCEVVGGSTPGSGNPDFWNGEIVWVTPADLGRNVGMFVEDGARKITRSGYQSCGTNIVPAGSVVLSSRDAEAMSQSPTATDWPSVDEIMTHETGHLGGAPDRESGIMDPLGGMKTPSWFSPQDIAIFRTNPYFKPVDE